MSSVLTPLLVIVLIGLCLYFVKKSGGGCCGMKKSDSAHDKEGSDKKDCCGH